ncbi:hypothetical protein [Paraburkholderia youngii]|uniref:Uncharacterized protein n=1 Tax=Paraburkholderia youngii TaxID=2782701 RepID=A0A7Y6MZC9_9BURK|nr:hypothetical protein [Paraburkholderia youngii]NUX99865.1 hypothetical protein [Paraburkholderia youngii]
MRHNEVEALPHFCLAEVTAGGVAHYMVQGRVTKLTGGKPKRAQWVTSSSGRRAIVLAQRISRAVYGLAGDTPKDSTSGKSSHCLFVSIGSIFSPRFEARNRTPNLQFSERSFNRLRSVLEIAITEKDIEELELVDPERDWRGEGDFSVGQRWRLTTHQFRRSLALYAHASGLVSLPSLKRQLQHITHEMSLYYARGSQFAGDFISGQQAGGKHFGVEWQATEPDAEYLGHLVNVEMGDPGQLSGGYAIWYDRAVRRKQVSLDRETTLNEFRQGKRGYRETFAGGCTKVGQCDKRPEDPMNLECLLNDCKNLVIQLPKFERIIRIQLQMVMELDSAAPDLPETRIERDILARLLERRHRIASEKGRALSISSVPVERSKPAHS